MLVVVGNVCHPATNRQKSYTICHDTLNDTNMHTTMLDWKASHRETRFTKRPFLIDRILP